MDYQQVFSTLSELLDKYLIVAIMISLVVGIAMNYFGLLLYNFAIFLIGAAVGLVVGGLVGAGADSEIIKIVIVIALALIGGSLAVFLSNLAAVLAGAAIGGIAGAALGSGEPVVIILLALIGGYLGYLFYNIAIILSTIFIGAVSLLYSYINILYFFKNDAAPWTFSKFNSYISRLITESYNQGSLDAVWATASHDFIVLTLFAISGFIVQIKFLIGYNAEEVENNTNKDDGGEQ